MRIYFLGIGGTLMGSLAQLAKELGHEVTGADAAIYPPMSDQLAAAGIRAYEGFEPGQLRPEPDLVVMGNAKLPRGASSVEHVLNRGLRYVSGAEWLGTEVLPGHWVLAVAGTHGKTSTASMLAWILERAGLEPGYLIGGAPLNFERSARLGAGRFFVVEADEYDTSYFDRRSKFVHYRPRTLVINNLEFDHADIFPDLAAIQAQFHQLLRTVPGEGLIIAPAGEASLDEVLRQGCWTQVARIGDKPPEKPVAMDSGELWRAASLAKDGSAFDALLGEQPLGRISWPLVGEHNQTNALGALAAARHAGVPPAEAAEALCQFAGVKRRLELIAEVGEVRVYDDFAHHPTAIRKTLQGLRARVGGDEILAVVEPRTHTMSLGVLRRELIDCCAPADGVFWFRGENIQWNLAELVSACVVPARQFDDLERLMEAVADLPRRTRHVVLMSNGGFGGIHQKLPALLQERVNSALRNKEETP